LKNIFVVSIYMLIVREILGSEEQQKIQFSECPLFG